MRGRFVTGLLLGATAMLLFAAPALATTRYAAPAASGTGDCLSQANACALATAVNASSGGDDVQLVGGIAPDPPFDLSSGGTLNVNGGITVHGSPGLRPTVEASAGGGGPGFILAGGTLRDMIVNYRGSNQATIEIHNGTLDRVSSNVIDGGSTAGAVRITGPATVRNSAFWNKPSAADAAQPGALDVVGTSSFTVTLQNVTAVSAVDAPGIRLADIVPYVITVNATNTIARSAGPLDVAATVIGGSPGTAKGIFDHSNYRTASAFLAGFAEVTPPNSATNTNGQVSFVDQANGDLRQTAASAGSIDLGAGTVGTLGDFDVFGSSRVQDGVPDIGADEIGTTSQPGVNSPIVEGDTSVSGITSEADGTTIEVEIGGVSAGTATSSAGHWEVAGISPLVAGAQVRAKATAVDKLPSLLTGINLVLAVSDPPVITGPVGEGATSVSGTTTEADGTTIHLRVNGTDAATANATGGAWSATVPALAAGDVLTASAAASDEIESPPSASVTVQAFSQAPVVTGPLTAGATSVSGTSSEGPGTAIQLFVNGSAVLPTGTVGGGTWTINGLAPLTAGAGVTAVAQAPGELPSPPSAAVFVTPAPQPNGPVPITRPRCGKKKKLKKVKKRFKCVKKKKKRKR